MFKDPQFIITLQMALIGIVLVAGFYLVWKALSRIEEKVDVLLLDKQSQQLFQCYPDSKHEEYDQEGESCYTPPSTDAMMNAIFSEDMGDMSSKEGGFVIFSSPFQMPTSEMEEEVTEESNAVKIEEMKHDITAASDVTISHIGYSKTKLKGMSIDKLKELCEERQLTAEGTKNQLIERLLNV
jgi:hypothetical protein